ncbi:MAG TPA: nuclear transport factor 2 family protein, partial [Amnibacterium sp.]|uniref:nuclear transport factor 2 family protein n=1 Tax=Amnibacterium sp. TaxID=1872496 RepID=UPI002F926A68
QVRRNWSAILAGVPDLAAEMTDSALHLDDVWCEWTMSGTRRDGAPHHMVGPVVFTVPDGLITSARFYLEPVETDAGSVDAAVRRAVGVAR